LNLAFAPGAWRDYRHWLEHDRRRLERVNVLIREVMRTPFAGIGKPEPLRGEFSGWWSRRIDAEQRLVYRAGDEGITIAQCRFHYLYATIWHRRGQSASRRRSGRQFVLDGTPGDPA